MASCSEPGAGTVATAALRLAGDRPATLGGGRLICIDGPAGAGKTTLGRMLSGRTGAPLVHMDDLYEGWTGLPEGITQLRAALEDLAAGRSGRYRRYDWHLGRYAETVTLEPAPLLVVEGCGAGARGHTDLVTVLVWVDAAWETRLRRGLARDGTDAEPHWRRWEADQNAHFATDRTPERADLMLATDRDRATDTQS